MGGPWYKVRGWLVILLPVLLFIACVRERSPITGRKQIYAFSWDQEQQIGKESDAEIVQQFGEYDDPALQNYVRDVGLGVLTKSDLRDKDAPTEYTKAPFTFRVLNSPIVNAFALPGGYVYVTRGLLTHLENEAQLAVVIGHEIGHVAARHAARQAVKAQVSQLGLIAAAILGSAVLDEPDVIQQVLGLSNQAIQLLLTKYSRDAEREADDLGVRYAALRGYEAGEAAAFFQSLSRISEKQGVRLPTWQSTHPDPGEREKTVRQLAQQYERPMDIRTIRRDEYLARLDGMLIGEDPREGFVENNRFYHPGLRFQFPVPSAWKVQNGRAAVVLIDPNREAVMTFKLAPARTAEEGAQKFAQTQGLQVQRSGAARLNGMSAYAVEAIAPTEQGTVGMLNYFIEHGNGVYSFMGYTAAQKLAVHRQVFERTIGEFAALSDARLVNIQPARLTTLQARRSGPFRSFLPERLPNGVSAEDLAILNQVRLEETVPVGMKLKLPR
jgi:predicted Zn-dependent protease